MAKAAKRLQAILDYMQKVKSITSTVHTHTPGVGGANERPKGMACAGAYIVRQVGGWADQKLLNYLFNYKINCELRKLAKHS